MMSSEDKQAKLDGYWIRMQKLTGEWMNFARNIASRLDDQHPAKSNLNSLLSHFNRSPLFVTHHIVGHVQAEVVKWKGKEDEYVDHYLKEKKVSPNLLQPDERKRMVKLIAVMIKYCPH